MIVHFLTGIYLIRREINVNNFPPFKTLGLIQRFKGFLLFIKWTKIKFNKICIIIGKKKKKKVFNR